MSRSRANFLLAVLAATAVAGSSGCSMIQRPGAEIVAAKLQTANLSQATMLFDVKVTNPYTVPLPLSNLDYSLASQGQKFLTGAADLQGDVPANGSKTLAVPLSISYLDLLNAVKGARPGGTIPYKADLGLSVKTPILGTMRLPMSQEGQIAIPSGSTVLGQLQGLVK